MSDAPLSCQAYSLSQLFTGRQFRLDYYQRDYVWTRDHVRALLRDLLNRFLSSRAPGHDERHATLYRPYSLGSIVYFEEDSKTYLVDGQQRVTTIHLLLLHLRRLFREQEASLPKAGQYASALDNLIWHSLGVVIL